MSLRVLHVIGGGDTGGAMANVLPLLTALRQEGVAARLACLGEGGLAEGARTQGLDPQVLPMSNPWDPRVLPPLWQLLRGPAAGEGVWPPGTARLRWDVVHSHGMRANLPVRLLVGGVHPRPCLVTTVHSDLVLDYSNPLQAAVYKHADRWSWGQVDRLVTVSQGLADALTARGWPRSKTAVVPSGVSLSCAEASTGVTYEGLSPHDGRPTVGTVARLVGVKDLDLLLEAAARLRRLVPDARVVIVGDGPEGPHLRAQAAARGLGDMIVFAGEVRPAWPAMETFDVYALTSKSEGLPVSVLEAMACGLPVVATRVGGLPELVQDGVSGFLVARDRPREETVLELADRLALVLSDQRLRRRMGTAGARRVAREFSARAVARRMLRVYERCLLEKAGRRRVGGC